MNTPCNHIQEQLIDLLLGQLDPQQEKTVNLHLDSCSVCQSCFEQHQNQEKELEHMGTQITNNLEDKQEKVINALNTLPRKTAHLNRTTWSIIMHSKITKPLAAAIIIIAGFLSLTLFDKTVPPAYALEQAFTAMENTTWMHIVGKQNDELQQEYWISYPEKIVAGKHSTGTITYQQDRMCYSYDQDSNILTISQSSENAFELLGDSPLGLIGGLKRLIKETEGEISQQTAEYLNKKVTIYNMVTVMGGSELSLEFIVDFEKQLPLLLKMNQKATVDQPAIETELLFDYPTSGPQSIYDLEVPANAIVNNNIPSDDIHQILDAYSNYRNKFTSEYIAIVVYTYQRVYNGLPYKTDIIYHNDKLHRIESYGIPLKNQKEYIQNSAVLTVEMGKTFETLYSWWTQNPIVLFLSINLYDGKFYYQCRNEKEGIWHQEPKIYAPKNNVRADDDIADFGWDVHLLSQSNDPRYTPLKIIETEYSTEHDLICLETTAQGQTITDSVQKVWAIAPTRKRYYLNPQKDYICERFEQEEQFDAPWQEDENWYSQTKEQEINENPCVNTIREITQYALTTQGQWYPIEIKQWNTTCPDDSLFTEQIHLKTNPEFPEKIFEPETLPK